MPPRAPLRSTSTRASAPACCLSRPGLRRPRRSWVRRGTLRDSMERLSAGIDPGKSDPGRWGHSFANLAEVFVPCLDAARARSVVEVGAYAGDLTSVLLK